MNSQFSVVNYRGLDFLSFMPWWNIGIFHGMTTRKLSFIGSNIRDSANQLGSAIEVDLLALSKQVHGDNCLDMRDSLKITETLSEHGDLIRRKESDAIIAPLKQLYVEGVVGFGILTADCVPVMIRSANGVALIHAGWRGLANGIIAKTASLLDNPQEAIILACAGLDKYEVGQEVIDLIGPNAVYVQRTNKFFLDTAATAASQLIQGYPAMQVWSANICTISDQRFHSFRRDGDLAGRCVSFFVPNRSN